MAFMSRLFHGSELHYPAIEKEATAAIGAVRRWSHFLARQHFTFGYGSALGGVCA